MTARQRSCELPEGIMQLHIEDDSQVGCKIYCVSSLKYYVTGHNLLRVAKKECNVSLCVCEQWNGSQNMGNLHWESWDQNLLRISVVDPGCFFCQPGQLQFVVGKAQLTSNKCDIQKI